MSTINIYLMQLCVEPDFSVPDFTFFFTNAHILSGSNIIFNGRNKKSRLLFI